MARRATNSDGSKVERRRQQRFAVHVPLEVSWRGPDDEVVKQEATARQVNANGGLLEMPHHPEMGSRVTIANLISAETAEARVLATPSTREGVAQGIIIELVTPDESFWGIGVPAMFGNMGLEFVPSFANFVLVKVGNGTDIFKKLMQTGIIVRDMTSYALPEWIRVSVGTMEQNQRFIAELKKLL